MNLPLRSLLILLVVGGACFFTYKHTPHHDTGNVFTTLYMHLVPEPLVVDNHPAEGHEMETMLEVPLPGFLGFLTPPGADGKLPFYNLQLFQLASVLLVFVCFLGVPAYIRTGKGDAIARIFSGWAMWIRDEMVVPVMGKEHGRQYLPYFLCLFFFLVFINLMGLVPMSVTATTSIFVTGAMALVTLAMMIGCGMAVQGPLAFWKNLVPHVPAALWPLMFVVEVIGLLVKPFALTIRLFANMSGGHMVVLSFMGLIFFFASNMSTGAGWGITPVAVGFAVFIMIIEAFVAMLQAFIFTQLSVIFVNASVHPEH